MFFYIVQLLASDSVILHYVVGPSIYFSMLLILGILIQGRVRYTALKPIFPWILFYFILIIISVLSGNILDNIGEILRITMRAMIVPILTYLLFCELSENNKVSVWKSFEDMIIYIAFLGSILSFIQFFTLDSDFYIFAASLKPINGWINDHRVIGLGMQPSIWAMFCSLGLLIVISRIKSSYRRNSIMWVTALIIVTSIILTESRTVMGALVIVFTINVFLLKNTQLNVLIKVVTIVIISAIFTYIYINLDELVNLLTAQLSVGTRIFLVNIGIEHYLNNPIFGIGYGEINKLFEVSTIHADRSTFAVESEAIGSKIESHNLYLRMLVELGLVGLISTLYAFYSSLIFMMRKSIVYNNLNNNKKYYGLFFIIVLIANFTQNNEMTYMLWFFMLIHLVYSDFERNNVTCN